MQIKLYNMLYKNKDMVNLLNEPEEVMKHRTELNRQIKVMREAQKIIRRDPEYVIIYIIKLVLCL